MYPNPTTRAKRLTNYIIDAMAFGIIYFSLLLLVIFLIQKYNISIEFELEFDGFIFFICYFSYYFLSEAFTGRTIGKLITGTKVVHFYELDKKVTIGQIFFRSLIRLVPFEVFSFLSENPEGWHDDWSNTTVVDIRKIKKK